MNQREYKFRDFDLETKTIRHFTLEQYNREQHDFYGNTTQYLGLKDRNSTEIYQGDILCIAFGSGYLQGWFGNSRIGKFMKEHEADAFIRIEANSNPLDYTLIFRRNGALLMNKDVHEDSDSENVFFESSDSYDFLRYTCDNFPVIVGNIYLNPHFFEPALTSTTTL